MLLSLFDTSHLFFYCPMSMISIWTNCFDWQSWARNNFLASQQRQRDNEKQRNRASGSRDQKK